MEEATPEVEPAPQMFLISVIPLSREPLSESLSYFSKKKLPAGSLVEVPVRNRHLFALVSSCESVLDLKSAIKNAPFPIKKIDTLKEGLFFDAPFLEAIRKASHFFAVSPGALLRTHIPEAILENWDGLEAKEMPPRGLPAISEQYLLQAPITEREGIYRAKIREEFAKKHSILLLVPSKSAIDDSALRLSRGIEEYTIKLHGDLPAKELLASWNKALSEEHPVLVIATAPYLALPRHDIGTYIIEHEAGAGYRSIVRPYYDSRTIAAYLAAARGASIIFADTLLSFETLHKKELGEAQALAPLKHRLVSSGETAVIDLKKNKEKKGDYFLSAELLSTIKETLAREQNLFLFTTRKGIAPLTVCNDCSTTLGCSVCGRPLVLYAREAKKEGESKNVFVCHSCSKEYPTDTRCAVCGSWRLAPLGVGVERVKEAIREAFPEAHIFSVDRDSTKTHKQALEVAGRFQKSSGAILIGTEMALPYLTEISVSAVVSADNLFAIPDFRINERLMHILVEMREKTRGAFIIQTRKPDLRIFTHAKRGTIFDFYREEMENRKKYDYPPYSVFVKITRTGKSMEVHAEMDTLEIDLAEWKPEVFSGFAPPHGGEETMHALVRLEPSLWPHDRLIALLRKLPPKFYIEVDPEELF
ncbi:MAG: primosomal protein N' [Patescibacteria group bacterium]